MSAAGGGLPNASNKFFTRPGFGHQTFCAPSSITSVMPSKTPTPLSWRYNARTGGPRPIGSPPRKPTHARPPMLEYPWNARPSLSMDAAGNVAFRVALPPAHLMGQPAVAVALQQLFDRERRSGGDGGSCARERPICIAYSAPCGPHDPIERATQPRHCDPPERLLDSVPMMISFCIILRRGRG